jgi:hypothetical protein
MRCCGARPAPGRRARLALGFAPTRNALRRRVSGLSIAYPPPRGEKAHPWAGRRVPDVTIGGSRLYERMRDGRFVLLDRTDAGEVARTAKEGWYERVDIVRIPTASARNLPAVLLVRPDGYAAWATDAPAAEERFSAGRVALRRWCGCVIARKGEHENC